MICMSKYKKTTPKMRWSHAIRFRTLFAIQGLGPIETHQKGQTRNKKDASRIGHALVHPKVLYHDGGQKDGQTDPDQQQGEVEQQDLPKRACTHAFAPDKDTGIGPFLDKGEPFLVPGGKIEVGNA